MKPSLLFLPGFACRPWIWDELATSLGFPYQAIAWPEGDTVQQLTERILPELRSSTLAIGHSMGGLVGLELLERGIIERLVLVETFITPPPPFFRNLLLEGSPWESKVQEMLFEEKKRYPMSLAESLRVVDSLALAERHFDRITAVYGDRGKPARVETELGWPDGLGIPVRAIPHSCHFPMLENPEELARVLSDCLKTNRGNPRN